MKSFLGRGSKKPPERRVNRLSAGDDNQLFRRSRTLTGSSASEVKAAVEQRGGLKSDRVKKHARKRARRSAGMLLLALVAAGIFVYYLASQYIATIQLMAFSPQPQAAPQAARYQEGIEQYLAARPGERFRFALNQRTLSQYMQQKFPEIASVMLTGGADFHIELRKPIARWQVGSRQFFVDSNGEAFEKNYYPAPQVNVVDKSGAAVSGTTLASQGFLRFLGRLVALVNTSGLGQVTEATLPPGTTREIDIRLQGRGYTVKTHTDRDPAAEVEDLKRSVAFFEQRHMTPSYIDIRVPGKAFYR